MMTAEHSTRSASASQALAVWERIWSETAALVGEARSVLLRHLGEAALFTEPIGCDERRAAGDVVIGRTRFRLECLLVPRPAGPAEARLAEVFGPTTPLVRVAVYRTPPGGQPVAECEIAADPLSGVWLASGADVAPASLDDGAALERFLWSFLADLG